MNQKKFWLTSLRARIFCLLMTSLAIPTFIFSQFTLDEVEKEIDKDYPIAHVDVDTVRQELASTDDIHPYDVQWGQLLDRCTK